MANREQFMRSTGWLALNGQSQHEQRSPDYASSEQNTYDRGFCYTTKDVNGMNVRIELSTKAPEKLPQNAQAICWQKAGLSSANLAELRSLCPYL